MESTYCFVWALLKLVYMVGFIVTASISINDDLAYSNSKWYKDIAIGIFAGIIWPFIAYFQLRTWLDK